MKRSEMFKKMRELFGKCDQKSDQGVIIYEIDNIEAARQVSAKNPDVCVQYHNPNVERPSIVTYKAENGNVYRMLNLDDTEDEMARKTR